MEATGSECAMAEAVEGGAALAWRLLATLEGGSLVLATSALLAYTARRKIARRRTRGRLVRRVLITNSTTPLGEELKKQLEARGCTVTGRATSGADKVDALVVVGAEPAAAGLDGLTRLVSEDVYENMRVLESLSRRVSPDGYIAWACAGAGATSGAFSDAATAFDAAIHASVRHAAKTCQCIPIWVGRQESSLEAARRVVEALTSYTTEQDAGFSIRNAAYRVSGYIGRWLKIAT